MLNSSLNAGSQVPFGGSWSRELCWAKWMLQPSWYSLSSLFYLSLSHQERFFLSFLYAGESRKSSICFLHQAFLSVSLGKYCGHPLDKNLVGQSSKCCQWQHGGEAQGEVQEHPTAWLSISSSDCSPPMSPHSNTLTHGTNRAELLVMLVHLPCGGTGGTHWILCLVGSCHALMEVPTSIPPSALENGEDIQSSLEQIYHRMMYLCLATLFP